jgi:hypothetical protein
VVHSEPMPFRVECSSSFYQHQQHVSFCWKSPLHWHRQCSRPVLDRFVVITICCIIWFCTFSTSCCSFFLTFFRFSAAFDLFFDTCVATPLVRVLTFLPQGDVRATALSSPLAMITVKSKRKKTSSQCWICVRNKCEIGGNLLSLRSCF